MIGLLEIRRRKVQFALIALVVTLITYLVLMINGLGIGLNVQAGSALKNFDADGIAYSDRAGRSIIRSELSAETVEAIQTSRGVEEAAPVGYVAVNYERRSGVVKSAALIGFDPGSIAAPKVTRGRAIDTGEGNALLADRLLLDASGLDVGDKIALTTSGLRTTEFTIVGEVSEGALFFQPTAFVLRETWSSLKYGALTEDERPAASIVLVQGEGTHGAFTGYEVIGKDTAFGEIEGVREQQQTVQTLQVFGYLIGALVIAVFFYVLTLQKVAQIGVLKAVGASSFFVFKQVVIQVLAITLAGVVIAVPLAWATNKALEQLPDPVPIAFSTSAYITTSLAIVLTGLLGALFSGRQVLRVDPIIALGQQQ